MNNNNPLKRSIGIFSLTFSSITSMIGSGWLFGAYFAAKLAGPDAVYAWMIGGLVVMLIALTTIEVSSLIPKSGGMARYFDYTHGPIAGFIMAFCNWLGIITVIPIEAQATIEYLSSLPIHSTYVLFDPISGSLTAVGLFAASVLIFLFFLLNYWGIKLFIYSMVSLTIVKIAVPIFTVIALTYSGFHADNFTVTTGLSSNHWLNIITAISTCGIILSFNGFQTPTFLGDEIKNPKKTLLIGILSAIAITTVIYVLLQVVFIGSLNPSALTNGWQHINFQSPFAQLALGLNLNILLLSLYIDAVISPSVTGITYMATSTRTLYGMAEARHIPRFFSLLNAKKQISKKALVLNFAIALAFLFCYRGWGHLVTLISVLNIISYVASPITAASFRKLIKKPYHSFRVPYVRFVGLISFIIISLMLYSAKWPTNGEVIGLLFFGLILYLYSNYRKIKPSFACYLKTSIWLLSYLLMIALISYLGTEIFGGLGIFNTWQSISMIVVIAIVAYFWGLQSATRTMSLIQLEKQMV